MPHENGHSSAELEREVEAQRAQVESTIGEIKERLSPGQLVDELLSYTKHGGGHFAANLGQTVTANPVPAALLGISLAWLMAGPKAPAGSGNAHGSYHGPRGEPGYRAVRGRSLQRVGHAPDEASGLWYSEFTDDAGAKYRARSDKAGRRMGHFMDETGKAFGGFFDETGQRIEEFRDDAGNLIDEAMGWANHAWEDATSAASRQFGGLAQNAQRLGGDASRMTRDALHVLEDQPLVMGALAFAAGAALGATLPHTKQEDEILGDVSDDVKREAGKAASGLYEQGKEKAEEIYDDVRDKAGEIYDDAKRKIAGDGRNTTGTSPGTIRH